AVDAEAPNLAWWLPAWRQMKCTRRGTPLFRRKACRDIVPAGYWCQVPREGQDVMPMAVRMEQVADPLCIPGSQCCFKGGQPVLSTMSGLLRSLEFSEGLIEV